MNSDREASVGNRMRETHTYEAYLEGNTLRWIGKSPTPDEMSKPRRVTIEMPVDEVESLERAKQAAEILHQLSTLNPFADIADPSEWQRDIRKDRPISGRE